MNLLESIMRPPKIETQPRKPNNDGTSGGEGAQQFLSKGLSGLGSYSIQYDDWYTAKPYGFKANLRDGRTVVMFLPINPTNLTITTEFATNVIPTLYGTVEEHSDVRYFNISIEGTTGMAPKFVDPYISGESATASDAYSAVSASGRSSFKVDSSMSLGGFFPKTLAMINNIKNKVSDIVDGSPKPKMGLSHEESGYVAFHNLYRFLLQYKKDAAGIFDTQQRKTHPLTFFNYKDNNQYDVVVKSFTLRRSADNPMLYFYSIQLRGYNLRTIEKTVSDDITKRLADFGLDGLGSSKLEEMKDYSSKAKAVLGALAGGFNTLGR